MGQVCTDREGSRGLHPTSSATEPSRPSVISAGTKLRPLQANNALPQSFLQAGRNPESPLQGTVHCCSSICSRLLQFCSDLP